MKKLILLLSATVAGLSASELSWEVAQVTFNNEEFISQSGFVERGIYGYLCCKDMTPARYMRKRLKAKDLLYQGKPLAQHARADDILSAFVEKHNLSICPFKNKNDMRQHELTRRVACCDAIYSKVGCVCCGAAASLGCCIGLASGSSELGVLAGFLSCLGLALPYTTAAGDTLVLYHYGLAKDDAAESKKEQ